MSLFNLFSRPKVEKARGHTEVGLAVPMRPQTPPRSTAPSSASRSSLRQNPSPPAQQTIRARSSQMFRQSMRPTTPSLTEFGTWEPPPLFQAFPQSLKHATVQACVFPPEMLMRTQSQRRQAEMLRERIDSARDLSTIAENETEAKKLEKTHRRLVSNSVLNPPAPELVNKIYILVTAGYVLQYAGDGAFDRTPEKVLKLGKDSAAFACDLIPGKHWVLQISSHAHNDGTIDSGPKSSLLSRLRSQNNATKRAAASFLLVLESAEEMDAWMTVVRKEIDTLGGVKPKDHSERSSSSIDSFSEKKSVESFSHRYLIQRDPKRVSKIGPVDSPQQPSQHAVSPKVVSSEWDGNRSDLALNVAEISGAVSVRGCNSRQSNEMSSVASTPVSQHHAQLDQIRGRSRSSFMSSTTTTSGVLTQNTSRDSSPAPHSPLKEEFSTGGEIEPLRSAMSLKSFHMNPANSSASRRRSMQPLPVTNEDFPAVTKTPVKRQRHSLCSPTSPTMPELGRRFTDSTTVLLTNMTTSKTPASGSTSVDPVAGTSVVLKKLSVSDGAHQLDPAQEYTREDSPLRYSMRNFSAPPRFGTISPPPREPAPLPPKTARRQSILNLPPPSTTQNLHLNTLTMTETRPQRRLSSTPKPFLRPLPVRHQDGSMIIPRRQSSLAPTSAPAPLPLGINVGRSVTAPVRFENSAPMKTLSNQAPRMSLSAQSSQSIHRPTSVQIRADAAPFSTSTRPARVISSTPSFLPGRRASNVPTSAPRPHVAIQPSPSIDTLRQQALAQQTEIKAILPRRSLPAMNLPPPAPPPNMALPPLPPNVSAPTPPPSVPLPSLPISSSAPTPPPSISLPTPPPSLPVPPVPTSTQTKVVIV